MHKEMPLDVQDVPLAAVPPEQEQVFGEQETRPKWKPAEQLVQIEAPLELQDDPVAAVPPEQEQAFAAQEIPLR
jgi:hypothetical protein